VFFKKKYCPTCKKHDQLFRRLDAKERAVVEERHRGQTDLWRCTAAGCRWYQPWSHQRGGAKLPDAFQNPAPDTAGK